MPQKTHTFALSLAALLLLGAVAPPSVNAWPLGKVLHLHPPVAQGNDARVTVRLFNKSNSFQEIKVEGHIYTVMPHYGVIIKAPAGTAVFANTTNFYHRKGDLLFSITPDRNAGTVSID